MSHRRPRTHGLAACPRAVTGHQTGWERALQGEWYRVPPGNLTTGRQNLQHGVDSLASRWIGVDRNHVNDQPLARGHNALTCICRALAAIPADSYSRNGWRAGLSTSRTGTGLAAVFTTSTLSRLGAPASAAARPMGVLPTRHPQRRRTRRSKSEMHALRGSLFSVQLAPT